MDFGPQKSIISLWIENTMYARTVSTYCTWRRVHAGTHPWRWGEIHSWRHVHGGLWSSNTWMVEPTKKMCRIGTTYLMWIYEWWVSPKETCVMGLGVLIQVWSMLDLDLNSNQGHNMFIHDGSRSGHIVLRIQIKDVNGPIWSGLMQVWSPSPSFNTLLCFWTGRKRCSDRASHLESEPSRPWHCAVPSRERLERAKVLKLLFSLIIV